MGNVMMEASQINYRGAKKMSVEQALKETSGDAAAIAALQIGKANLSVIAPAFSAETAYAIGDIVTYEGAIYRCTTAHEGAWDATDFTATTISGELASLNGEVSDLNSTKANQITIAPSFSAETAYDPGDLVYYNGLTYRCTNAHEGAWDAQDFAATTIANELAAVKSGLTNFLKRGYFNIACQQGENVFNTAAAQLVSGSFPDIASDCIYQIVNHGTSYSPPNVIEVDGSDTIIITATAAQNIQVMWVQCSNIPLTN